MAIHPPYIWFGGKRTVAPIVWEALGDVASYIEPFFGGGAVWLLRPHVPRLETINDIDGFVANFWRALQADPEAVASAMDWPINEIDLQARHRALCRMPDKAEFVERMRHDPDYYDIQRAAWWCWGLNAWIGGDWCGGEYWPDEPERTHGTGLRSDGTKLPHLGSRQGTHRLSASGSNAPHVGNGRGTHRLLAPSGRSVSGECARRAQALRDWMTALADRLRNVRVCCGDWERVCTDGAMAHGSSVGIFLDPPYSGDAGRDTAIYRCEDVTVAQRVQEWCLKRGAEPRYRIVLAGYAGEHEILANHGWRCKEWSTRGGMAYRRGKEHGRGVANRNRERLWLSPSCQDQRQTLWGLL